MPTFRNGYDKHLDLTEDEYLAQLMDTADYLDDDTAWVAREPVYCPGHESPYGPMGASTFCDGTCVVPEPEPFEDTYLPGIPDYDRFNRPSWEA